MFARLERILYFCPIFSSLKTTVMIELPPTIKRQELQKAMFHGTPEALQPFVDKVNDTYEYWDKVKYIKLPEAFTATQLWTHVKAVRAQNRMQVWKKYGINLAITNRMQQACHEFDMNFGGSWGSLSPFSNTDKGQYLVSSLMEEAIFSSQMEGAATTRKVAKEMLRKQLKPRDKSQQMIVNNYETIRFIVEHKHIPLTPELLQDIHRLMTNKTLERESDAGAFRQHNDIVVEDGITHDIVHRPPSFEDIPGCIEELCSFFNSTENKVFIHPLIRGIIIHFMVAYLHPFVDGNGRTARALFYFYLLKSGYWLAEYLSVSRIIAGSKSSYEKSYLYTEHDERDIGYFVAYNLRVLKLAFNQLQAYIKRKQDEKEAANLFLKEGELNGRQAQIVKMFAEKPQEMITVKDLEVRFLVTPTTVKSDLTGLLERRLLKEIPLNKVKKGYIKGDAFDAFVQAAKA